MKKLLGSIVVSLFVCIMSFGQIIIKSFDHNGVLMCTNVQAESGYIIEWSSSPDGPWTALAVDMGGHSGLNGHGWISCLVRVAS